MSSQIVRRYCSLLVIACLPISNIPAQTPNTQSDSNIPEIADSPSTVDPAVLMPANLAVRATHDFSDSSLREVVAWLEDNLVVLLDENALAEIGLSPAEPISDRIDDAPLSPLAGLTTLDGLILNDTRVNQAEVEQLKAALPECAIFQ